MTVDVSKAIEKIFDLTRWEISPIKTEEESFFIIKFDGRLITIADTPEKPGWHALDSMFFLLRQTILSEMHLKSAPAVFVKSDQKIEA